MATRKVVGALAALACVALGAAFWTCGGDVEETATTTTTAAQQGSRGPEAPQPAEEPQTPAGAAAAAAKPDAQSVTVPYLMGPGPGVKMPAPPCTSCPQEPTQPGTDRMR